MARRPVDRRFRTPTDTIPCRCCFRPLALAENHVEQTPAFDYYRCPHCGLSFPVRRV